MNKHNTLPIFSFRIQFIFPILLVGVLLWPLSGVGQGDCSGYGGCTLNPMNSDHTGLIYTLTYDMGMPPTEYTYTIGTGAGQYDNVRDFLCSATGISCDINVPSDVFEDGYDYIVIPENVRLVIDDPFILTDKTFFPRPIIFLIVGDDITGGVLAFVENPNNPKAFIYLSGPIGGKNSDIRLVEAIPADPNDPFVPIIRTNGIDDAAGGNLARIVIDQDNDYNNAIPQNMYVEDPGDIIFVASSGDEKKNTIAEILAAGSLQAFIALPVELAWFRARADDQGVLLAWQTVWEADNDYFEVQHSKDGVQFYPLDRIKGRGTTELSQHYTYRHAQPFPGVNYYRLRQVDFDGATEYHPVVSVVFDGAGEMTFEVFPNPVGKEDLRIRWYAPGTRPTRLRLIDGRGIVRREQLLPEGNGLERVAVGDLPAGIYFLQLVQGAVVRTVRVVIL